MREQPRQPASGTPKTPVTPKPRGPSWMRLLGIGIPVIGVLAAVGAVVGVLAYRATAPSDSSPQTVTHVETSGSGATSAVLPTLTASPPAGTSQPGKSQQPAGTAASPGSGDARAGAGSGEADSALPSAEPTLQPPAASPTADSDDARRLVVINAAPDGVRLRSEPGDGEPLMVLADGTEVDATSETHEVSGRLWRQVREASGRLGWVAADFLAAVQPTAMPPPMPTVVPTPLSTPARPAATVVPTEPPRPQPPAQPTAPSVQPTAPPPPTQATAPVPPAQAAPPLAAPASAQATPASTSLPSPLPAPVPAAAPTRTPVQAVSTVAPPSKPAGPGTGSGTGRSAPRGRACPPSHPIKGNHSSSGEWIYHPPRGQFYNVTIPEDCFATEADARAAGYRASLR